MLECWNNGKEENELKQNILFFLKSIIPLFQYSSPKEFATAQLPFWLIGIRTLKIEPLLTSLFTKTSP
jgi:hypothetical protein